MRAKTSVMYDMVPIRSPIATGLYKSKNWYFERSFFTQTENDPMVVGRSKAQAEAGAGLVFLHRYLRGGIRGVAGDINIDRDPGQLYLFDQACRVNVIQLSMKAQGIYLPKSLVGFNSDQHPPIVRLSEYGAIGASLFHSFDRLMNGLNQRNAIDRNTYDSLIASLQFALGAENTAGDIRRRARNALGELIRKHIERHVDQPDLSAATLLKRFGVSRATLFRIFESEGGVRHFIQQRRLHRAVLDIAQNAGARGAVTAAAARWRFSSGANFNRSVRNMFGVAPGSLVGATVEEVRYPGVGDDIHAFLHQSDLIAA